MGSVGTKRYGHELVMGVLLGIGCLGLVQPGFARTKTGRNKDENPRIIVAVRDYAEVGRSTLDRSEREVARIFQEVGIEITWLDCPRTEAERDEYRACFQPGNSPRFDMNIVPRSMEARYPTYQTALGFTSRLHEGEPVFISTVFYDRVKEEAERTSVVNLRSSVYLVLGHAMAHELGHLLLRTHGHSAVGIMRVPWTSEDLRKAAWGHLLFTPQQAEQMRREVRARAQPQATAEVGSHNGGGTGSGGLAFWPCAFPPHAAILGARHSYAAGPVVSMAKEPKGGAWATRYSLLSCPDQFLTTNLMDETPSPPAPLPQEGREEE